MPAAAAPALRATALLAMALLAGPAARAEAPVASVETRLDPPEAQDRDTPAWPVAARLTEPTDRYRHDILGTIPPFAVLEVEARACGACRHGWESAWTRLPEDMVFEDVAPRLWDVTGDGRPEIVVVETHVDQGAGWPSGPMPRRAAT